MVSRATCSQRPPTPNSEEPTSLHGLSAPCLMVLTAPQNIRQTQAFVYPQLWDDTLFRNPGFDSFGSFDCPELGPNSSRPSCRLLFRCQSGRWVPGIPSSFLHSPVMGKSGLTSTTHVKLSVRRSVGLDRPHLRVCAATHYRGPFGSLREQRSLIMLQRLLHREPPRNVLLACSLRSFTGREEFRVLSQ